MINMERVIFTVDVLTSGIILITDGKCMFDPKKNIISEIRTQLNLLSPLKTMNYETGYEVRMKIREKIIEYGRTFPGWHPIIGDVIQIPKFMINS
jgi:hypothetical protein